MDTTVRICPRGKKGGVEKFGAERVREFFFGVRLEEKGPRIEKK